MIKYLQNITVYAILVEYIKKQTNFTRRQRYNERICKYKMRREKNAEDQTYKNPKEALY